MTAASQRKPTLSTVARAANVSIATASRALNGIQTHPETVARVVAAAESVGYMPNAAARSLRSQRTGHIAFAMPDVANPVYTRMVRVIQEAAAAAGSRLVLHSTGSDAADELEIVRDLGQGFVDGLIIATLVVTEAHAEALREAAAPVVVIGRLPKGLAVDAVEADSRRGAGLAVAHLHALGRRRIAFVNGPVATLPGHERRLGYLEGLRDAGQERDDALVEVADDFTADAGYAAAERLLHRGEPDAILFANDLLAAGGLRALHRAGLSVPDDVAIAGMDDTDLAELCWPALTSVDLGSGHRARIAADLLLARLGRPDRTPQRVRYPARLVVRDSAPRIPA